MVKCDARPVSEGVHGQGKGKERRQAGTPKPTKRPNSYSSRGGESPAPHNCGEGAGEFFLDGVATQVKMGDMIFAEANVLQGVRNTGDTRMTFYFIKMMGKHA